MSASCTRQTVVAPLLSPTSTPQSSLYNYSHKLLIGPQILNTEIASTTEALEQGLSDRESMGQNQAMLFDFGSDKFISPGFWMKDMKFNLDFIWIKKDSIVGITADVPAPASCQLSADKCLAALPVYYPPSPVNWVVEVNAGWAKKNNIAVGDEVRLEK